MKKGLKFALVAAMACSVLVNSNSSIFAATVTSTVESKRVVDNPYPGRLIDIGLKGEVVKVIQSKLHHDGFSVGQMDGNFGPLTEHGVRRFQKANHLTVDGIVGPKTWAVLFHSSSKLLTSIQRYASTRTSDISVAVYDKRTNQTYVYDSYQVFDTASIVKPLILATLLHENEMNHQTLTSLEKQLAIPMMEQSNNQDATKLWNIVGRSKGVGVFTRLDRMSNTTPNALGYWGLTTTTALDQVRLVKHFAYPNHLLNSQSRDYGLYLMRHVVSWEHWGVSAGVSEKDSVALKNGWLPIGYRDWEINSIGYVTGNDTSYVIAILTRNNPTEAYGIATTEGISRLIWKRMRNERRGMRSKPSEKLSSAAVRDTN